MSLFCDDGKQAAFPSASPPPAKPERGAPWRPPDHASATCQRCGRLSWQHRSHPPVLADEMDRAIYAAAFVAALNEGGFAEDGGKGAIETAELVVAVHRRARSGT